jgi:hypothetical protein
LKSWIYGEFEFALLATIDGQTSEEQRSESCTSPDALLRSVRTPRSIGAQIYFCENDMREIVSLMGCVCKSSAQFSRTPSESIRVRPLSIDFFEELGNTDWMMTPRKSRRTMEDLKDFKLWSFVSLLSAFTLIGSWLCKKQAGLFWQQLNIFRKKGKFKFKIAGIG